MHKSRLAGGLCQQRLTLGGSRWSHSGVLGAVVHLVAFVPILRSSFVLPHVGFNMLLNVFWACAIPKDLDLELYHYLTTLNFFTFRHPCSNKEILSSMNKIFT